MSLFRFSRACSLDIQPITVKIEAILLRESPPLREGAYLFEMMKTTTLLVAAVTFCVMPACSIGGAPEPEGTFEDEQAIDAEALSFEVDADISAESPELYYITTRPDFRDCAWPQCGGYFIKGVNLKETKCFGGVSGKDCYVTGWDFSALGLNPDEEQKLTEMANNGDVVMRGHYAAYGSGYSVAKLVVTQAWAGVSGDDPKGSFYGVESNGIVCVTYPCPSYDQTLLNLNQTATIAGVDLTQTSATAQQIQDALIELNTTGLVIAGENVKVTGPAGTAKALEASEFYTQP